METTSIDSFNNANNAPVGFPQWIKKFLAFMGPGYLIAIGYIDPGNWATDIAAGSGFGYSLLWVILLSNLMAMLLQSLSIRLGVATGYDLAQASRLHYSTLASRSQWVLCEIAICACDLAEVIGTAIALKLLFGLPLLIGVVVTIADTFILLFLQNKGYRYLEAAIISLLAVVFLCFIVTIFLAQPMWADVARGFVPDTDLFSSTDKLYIAIGIIGATVMPHNLYLHSSLVKSRLSLEPKKASIRFATTDVILALLFAFFINAAILIVSSAVFNTHGLNQVSEIEEAHRLLSPLVGSSIASFLFALALLASGQSSTVTATMAGQIVMEGYLNIRLKAWQRRLITRTLAIVPAVLVLVIYGESSVTKLLVFSQVILSLQLPFAVIPLIQFTSNKKMMGEFSISKKMAFLSWITALLIVGLNATLIIGML